jgi:tetratricopeptide (TPR) repeat protein
MIGWWLFAMLLSGAADESHVRGVALFHDHKYAEAIGALTAAAKGEPKDSADYQESALLVAQSYFALAQAVKAIPWLESVPPSNESSYMLGFAYEQAGRKDDAAGAFAQLFGVKRDSAAAHLLTAQLLLKKQLENEGAEEAAKALAIDPKIPEAHFVIAEVAMFRGKVEESIGHLRQEVEVNPSFAMAWYRLGDAYTRLNQWDAAIVQLQKAVWLNPNFSGPFILLGKCYGKKNDAANSIRYLRQALQLDPNNYMAHFLLGRALLASGNAEEGRKMLKKSEELRRPGSLVEQP